MILLFSPFIDDDYLKYDMGWLMIGMVSFNLVVNMLIMLYNTFLMVKLYFKKAIKLRINLTVCKLISTLTTSCM